MAGARSLCSSFVANSRKAPHNVPSFLGGGKLLRRFVKNLRVRGGRVDRVEGSCRFTNPAHPSVYLPGDGLIWRRALVNEFRIRHPRVGTRDRAASVQLLKSRFTTFSRRDSNPGVAFCARLHRAARVRIILVSLDDRWCVSGPRSLRKARAGSECLIRSSRRSVHTGPNLSKRPARGLVKL